MVRDKRFQKIIIGAGDLLFLYLSLFIALILRYGSIPGKKLWDYHQAPFLFVYAIWIIVFYIAGLYDIEKFVSARYLRNQIFKAMAAGGILAMVIFYLIPSFLITPRINLFIDLIVSFFLLWIWRKISFSLSVKGSKIRVFFLGDSGEISGLANFLNSRPQLGYAATDESSSADIIVVPEEARKNKNLVQDLYNMILTGKNIVNFEKFYESITGKIPVSMISELWFLENLAQTKKENYEKFKRVMDIFFSLFFLVIFLIIYPFVAIAIKLNSKGPVLYRQKRTGKNGRIFEIIKFRSMVENAERNGAQWAKEGDNRVTFVGNILRKTRLDEISQVWNVIKGELSFIGPRPERPELIKELEQKVPHYPMRHLVKPGLTGWAQINFPYGASVEDATEKLQYDLYYIKNRTLLLDMIIILKTIAVILRRSGR